MKPQTDSISGLSLPSRTSWTFRPGLETLRSRSGGFSDEFAANVRALVEGRENHPVRHYSIISSVNRRFDFMLTAARIVPDRTRRPALPADYLPKIFRRDAKLEHSILLASGLTHRDLVRSIDQSFGDVFDQLFHHAA